MGVEDRDWYREEPKPRRTHSVSLPVGFLIVVGIIGGLVLAGSLKWATGPRHATYGGEHSSHQGAAKISLLPGFPGDQCWRGRALRKERPLEGLPRE